MSWRSLGSFWGPWSTFGRPWASGSLGGPRSNCFMNFGSFGGLGASFFDKRCGLERDFSTHAFGMVSGSVLCRFMVLQGRFGI